MNVIAVELPDGKYRLVEASICCAEMDEAWGQYVDFGNKEAWQPETNTTCDVNIYSAYQGQFGEGIHYSSMAIKYCPWCMRDIEVEITREAG